MELDSKLGLLIKAWNQPERRSTMLPYLGTNTCGDVADLASGLQTKLDEVTRLNTGLHDEVQFMRNAAKQNREDRDALAADNAVLREAAKIGRGYLLRSTTNRWTDEDLKIIDTALSKPAASLKAGEIPSGYGEYTPITVSASTSQLAEGQGERGEAKPVAYQWCAYEDGEDRTGWQPDGYGDQAGWKAIAKRKPANIQVKTRPLYATPPAPQPLEGAVKVKALSWAVTKALNGGRKLLAYDVMGNEFARLDLLTQTADEIETFKRVKQHAYNQAILSALSTPAGEARP